MPCFDPRDTREDCSGLQAKCDKLTRLLCEAMQINDALREARTSRKDVPEADREASGELRGWWDRHKQFDKKRGARK